MREHRRRVEQAAASLRDQLPSVPSVGILWRDEMGSLAAMSLRERWTVGADADAPGARPLDGAFGTLAEASVCVAHSDRALSAGDSPRAVVFPVRVMARAGIDTLLCAQTATSVASSIRPPALVLSTDHINFQGANPLVGPNVEEWGPRFPDMTTPYDEALRQRADTVALQHGDSLRHGIHFGTAGPDAGTRAERRMARRLGADLIGPHVVQEVIAARHMDMRVLAVSAVTEHGLRDGPDARTTAPEAKQQLRVQLQSLLAGVAAGVKSEEKSG